MLTYQHKMIIIKQKKRISIYSGAARRFLPEPSAAAQKSKTERGDTMVELDQFKTALNAWKEPFVEVRDSL